MADATGFQLLRDTQRFGVGEPHPVERPSANARAAFGGLGVALAVLTAVLLLSDRAPGILRAAFGPTAADLATRFNVEARAMLLLDDGLPETDTLVHVGLWSVVTCVVALTIWTWRGAAASAAAVFAGSVALELAQGRYSTTRVVELRDMYANGVGVLTGLTIAFACMIAWCSIGRTRRFIATHRPRRDAPLTT